MKNNTLHRHDISDRAWKIIEPHLPGRMGTKSRPKKHYGICHQNTEIGILLTVDLHAGEIKEFEQNYLNSSSKILILNGS